MQITEHNAVDGRQPAAVPTGIRYIGERRVLALDYAAGPSIEISAKKLREYSPSSVMQGPDGQRRQINVPDTITITAIEPIGNYAIRLTFSDGHASGIYSWQLLRELAMLAPNH